MCTYSKFLFFFWGGGKSCLLPPYTHTWKKLGPPLSNLDVNNDIYTDNQAYHSEQENQWNTNKKAFME